MFGITAAAWGAIATVGVAAYSADAQRKATNMQKDALNASIADDARQKVEAETGASLSANQKLTADKRARQANVLALGGGSESKLGSPASLGDKPNVLAQGSSGSPRPQAALPRVSVLGGA